MKIRFTLLAFLFLFQPLAHADTWTVRADKWCPYNCEPKSENPGYMIEIIELAAKANGHTVDYKLMPWSRALAGTIDGQITAVVGMTTGDSEGLISSEKMGIDSTCFFVNEGDAFKYGGLTDLAKLRSVGTAQDYGYPGDFMDWQKANPAKIQAVASDRTLEVNTSKLKGKRIQTFVENAAVLEYARKSIPALKGVVSAGCLNNEPVFVGFSPKDPKAAGMHKAVNAKFLELKKSGELAKILARYGVTPW